MIVKGIPLTRIAIEFGMSYDGLRRITVQPEYLKIEEEVRATMRQKMDQRLEQRAKMEEQVDDALPEAMQVLIDGVRKKKDLRAALELLDRDPSRQFAKGSNKLVQTAAPTVPPPNEDLLRNAVASSEKARQMQAQNSASTLTPTLTPPPSTSQTEGVSYDA